MHNVKIAVQSALTILNLMQEPEGWCNNIKLYSSVSSVLQIPVFAESDALRPSKPNEGELQVDYLKRILPELERLVEFELEEQQRDAIKACLKHAFTNSKIVPGKYATELITTFGLSD